VTEIINAQVARHSTAVGIPMAATAIVTGAFMTATDCAPSAAELGGFALMLLAVIVATGALGPQVGELA